MLMQDSYTHRSTVDSTIRSNRASRDNCRVKDLVYVYCLITEKKKRGFV
jgi:hypothetical protein